VKNLLKESLYVIFTSGNAVKYFLNGDQRIPDEGGTTAAKELTADHQAACGALFSPDWKIFCVQGSTSETVAALFGRERIVATATSAFALSEVIIDHLKREKDERSLVFFCGNRRRDEIPRACKTNGVPLKEVIVYQTIPMSKVITQEYDAIAFFS